MIDEKEFVGYCLNTLGTLDTLWEMWEVLNQSESSFLFSFIRKMCKHESEMILINELEAPRGI
uniref:Regulator n=1 Tax=Brugia pahangi TaxID=6280 RepID=A0A0N4T8F0_BRUPA